MGLVFAALIILILIIMAMERVFRSRGTVEPSPESRELGESAASEEGEAVAAISAALAILQQEQAGRGLTGGLLATPDSTKRPSPWASTGRQRQMEARQPRKHW